MPPLHGLEVNGFYVLTKQSRERICLLYRCRRFQIEADHDVPAIPKADFFAPWIVSPNPECSIRVIRGLKIRFRFVKGLSHVPIIFLRRHFLALCDRGIRKVFSYLRCRPPVSTPLHCRGIQPLLPQPTLVAV